MIIRTLFVLASLIISTSAYIDCTQEDTCFGEPFNCVPERNCDSLFHFDHYGNLHLHLRNFTDPIGYAAFAINNLPNDLIEFFLCIPNQSQLYRAVSELGSLILITDHNVRGTVDILPNNNFQCNFHVSTLPETFRQNQVFFVNKGTYDDVLPIFDGKELFNLDYLVDYELDLEEQPTVSTSHHHSHHHYAQQSRRPH